MLRKKLKAIFFCGLFAAPILIHSQNMVKEQNLESMAVSDLSVGNRSSLLFTYKPRFAINEEPHFVSYDDNYGKSSLFFKVNLFIGPSLEDIEYSNKKSISYLPIRYLAPTAKDGSIMFQVPLKDYVASAKNEN